MEKEKDGIYLMPDWFQDKAREQVKKEIADAAGNNEENKAQIRDLMQKEAEKLLGNDTLDQQEKIDKHIYI